MLFVQNRGELESRSEGKVCNVRRRYLDDPQAALQACYGGMGGLIPSLP